MPAVGPGEVLLRLGAGGICGSDLHYYFEGRNGNFVVREPLIPGHEASAVVAAIGAGVTRVKPATRWPSARRMPAGTATTAGRVASSCATRCGSSAAPACFPHVQGMFREYFVMGERQCYPVAADVSLGEIAFAEPLAVGLHAVNRGGDLLGKSVLITGAGTIGCLTVLAARLAGAAQVTVSDILDRPLAQARKVGADVTLHADARRRCAARAAVRRRLRGFGQLRRAEDLRRGHEARRHRRAGGNAAARAAAVRRQRDHGQGARPARRVPLGHRVRLGGRLPVVAQRRRAAAAVGPVSAADAVEAFRAAADKNRSTKVQVVA